ncbi:MAG: tetratricopeptide repeat protein [Candidatus Omnitrophica bacterium]|nr:tetratricopeptide repeat protein [Candidatus Omnitrophota bacterium]
MRYPVFSIVLIMLLFASCSGDPQKKAEKLARKALDAQLAGEYETAVQFLEDAIEIHPELAEAYIGLGQLYHYQEKRKEARDCYQKAIECLDKRLESNPNDVRTLINQAGVYAVLLKYSNARRYLSKVLEIEPENRTAQYLLQNMREFAGAWNQVPPPHSSEQKIQREMLAPLP